MNNEYESLIRQLANLVAGALVTNGLLTAEYQQTAAGVILGFAMITFGIIRTRMTRLRATAAIQVAQEAVTSTNVVPETIAPAVVEKRIQELVKGNGKH